MKHLVMWMVIRAVICAVLDVLVIHDHETAIVAWAAFTLVHIETCAEGWQRDRERIGLWRGK